MLFRFTSSSSLSSLRTLFSISSMFVGFGGSSGTGLYLSGCTTPVSEVRRETQKCPPHLLPVASLITCAPRPLPFHLFHPLLPFLRLGDYLPRALGATLPNTLTAYALGVADVTTADGVVVLLVAHQRVHAQNCWKESGDEKKGLVSSRPPHL